MPSFVHYISLHGVPGPIPGMGGTRVTLWSPAVF